MSSLKPLQDIQDDLAFSLFSEFLPYYWEVVHDLPSYIKLKLFLNGYTSIPTACMDLVKRLQGKKVSKEAQSYLRHMQVWKSIPDGGIYAKRKRNKLR